MDHAVLRGHPVLIRVSLGYPGLWGRLLTCYSPVRRSVMPCPYGLDVRRSTCMH